MGDWLLLLYNVKEIWDYQLKYINFLNINQIDCIHKIISDEIKLKAEDIHYPRWTLGEDIFLAVGH